MQTKSQTQPDPASSTNLPSLAVGRLKWLLLNLALCLSALNPAFAAPPDLTAGGVPSDTININLGPTGLRGWVYHVGVNTGESRQIQVQVVDTGSPADGVLAANDVILGANGTGAEVVNFTADARKSLAYAIADAETRTPATLNILRWRAGVTSTVSITLQTMGAYSATAPYNCPKSALILEQGIQKMMTSGTPGTFSLGTLALMAGNDAANPNNAARQARARTEALAQIPSAADMAIMNSADQVETASKVVWNRGHQLIVLAEYFMQTGDAQVMPAIQAIANSICKGQSVFGTMGHQFSGKWPDGSIHGPMGGYGTVNSASLPAYYGILLAKQCGVNIPELDPAIERAGRFFAYYAGRGVISYGEHEAERNAYESNGKSGLASMAFSLQSSRATESKYFAKMAASSSLEREDGHTGAYFNQMWAPLGASVGGEAAAAAYFAQTSWHYDLARRWDGSFVFQSIDIAGAGQYSLFNQSIPFLLTYALPMRQLRITGKNPNAALVLSTPDLADVAAALLYDVTWRTTNQLVADLGSWSTAIQNKAAGELGLRTAEHATLLPTLHSLANDVNGTSRVGACYALGKIANGSSATTLAALLTAADNKVRDAAAENLRYLPQTDRLSVLNTILAAVVSTAKPLLPMAEEDPLQFAHARLCKLLFNAATFMGPTGVIAGTGINGVDRNLLYPAIRAVAATPNGGARGGLETTFPNLTQADIDALAGSLLDCVEFQAPADKMFNGGSRKGALEVLKTKGYAEGVPVTIRYAFDGDVQGVALPTLQSYAASSLSVLPDPDVIGFLNAYLNDQKYVPEVQAVLAAIAADTNPRQLTTFKNIQSVTADSAALTMPAKWTVLRTVATDFAKGNSVYTWRKIRGAGNVSFTPNGTASAKDTTVLFDGTPGQYLIELKMSDSRGLTEVYQTVSVTLFNSGGTLPTNNPPTANPESVAVAQATPTPITLTGSDPEEYALNYSVTGQPTRGKLSGTAPYLLYTPDFNYSGADSILFQAMDSEGQVSTATISITVGTGINSPVAIHEPFAQASGNLGGQAGGVGLSGNWVGATRNQVQAGSLAFGNMATTGNRLSSTGGNSTTSIGTGTTLATAGLMADGGELWFSFLHVNPNDGNLQPMLMLGNQNASGLNTIASAGSAVGVKILGGSKPQAMIFNAGTQSTSVDQCVIAPSATSLIVGRIRWGANPSLPDTVEIYSPGTDFVLDSPKSISAVLDQSAFNKLSLWGNGTAPTMDEIRFGPTYHSVLAGTTAMAADLSPPTPNPSGFSSAPAPSGLASISMTAAPAYDPYDVEYYFACTAGGGHDSGWQSSTSYTDSGLTSGVQYSYTVKARDKSPAMNVTTPSASASATISSQTSVPDVVGMSQTTAQSIISSAGLNVGSVTIAYSATVPAGAVISQTPAGELTVSLGTVVDLVIAGEDTTAPTPDPATFTVLPAATSPYAITMTATTGSDVSGVEYRFSETSGNPGGVSSGWQSSPSYTNNGLIPATQYTYTVTIRDKSPNANQTVGSASVSVTTPSIPPPVNLYWDGGSADIPTNGNGASTGGTGSWNIGLLNWDLGAAAHVAWDNNHTDVAIFGGTAGTVTIGAPFIVGGLQFLTTGYTLSGNTLTLGAVGNITVTGTATINSILSGSYGFNKTGTGTLILNGANTFTGNSAINSGILQIGLNNTANGASLGGGSYAGNISIASGATLYVQTNAAQTLSGVISGAGKLTKSYNGTLILSGANTYTGKTWINPLTSAGAGTVEVSSFNSVNGGTPLLASSSLGAPTTVANGTVDIGNTGAQSGGTLKYTGSGETTDRVINFLMNGTGGGKTLDASGSGLLKFTSTFTSSGSFTNDMVLTGGGSGEIVGGLPFAFRNLTKSGIGTWTLGGSVSNTGTTTISGGTLLINGNSSGAIGAVAVNSTSTLGGSGTLGGTVTVAATANLAPGATVGTLAIGGGLNISAAANNGTGKLRFELLDPTASDKITVGGTLTIGTGYLGVSDFFFTPLSGLQNGTYTLFTAAAISGSLNSANLTGPIGSGTGTLQISGTSIVLNVSGVTRINNAPAWTGNPVNKVDAFEDSAYSSTLAGNASDADSDPLTFAKVSGPAWLSVAADGVLSGTPPNSDVGSNSFTVSVSDGIAAPVQATLNITVINENDAPVFAVNPISGANALEDVAYSGTISGTASDVDQDAILTYAKVSGPAWLNVASDGTLSGTPANGNVGDNSFTVSVSDGIAPAVNATLNTDVINTNDAPGWTSNPIFAADATEDASYVGTLAGLAGDVDAGSVLTYGKVSGPAWLNVAANGTLSGMPTNSNVGANSFTVSVSDGIALAVNATLTVTATNTNDAPTWTSDPIAGAEATEDAAYAGTISGAATDVDLGATLTYTKVSGPAWLTVSANGDLSGTPPNDNVGANSFTVNVSDGIATPVNATLNLTVINTNDAPVFTANPIAGADATEDAVYAGTIAGSVTDVDQGATLTYDKVSGPAWLSVASDGTLSGTPDNGNVGANSFMVSVSDGIAAAVNASLNITITNTNDVPTWTANPIAGADATEDAAYTGTIVGAATDVDLGATLTYAKMSGPAWLSVAANGALSGTPTNSDVGANIFTVSVNDGIAAVVNATLTITVFNTNDAPVAVAQSVTTSEDTATAITLVGTDVDGDALTYTILTQPSNGTMSGTAPNVTYMPATNYNGPDAFSFTVNDGTVNSATATVSITVTPVNDVPVFITNPIIAAGASEGTAYTGQTLVGGATDPDAGEILTYSKVSGPAWLSVAPDGAMSGTPTSGTAGLNSFVVRVTDSTGATADSTLQITVTALPLPWVSADIGTGMLAGSTTFSAGTFTQSGSGVIGSSSDKLRFTYQTLTGDGEVIAKISALQSTGNASRVGVMIRDSLAANSKEICMSMSGTNAYRWDRRTTTGGSTTNSNSSTGTVPNTWVRLVRSGTTITAYKSTNGTTWTTVGSTTSTTFASTCYIGLAVGSGSTTTLNTSQFSNLTVTP